MKRRILNAALKHVPALGWTEQALVQGARELELSPAAHGMFARGPVELVDHFMGQSLKELTRKMDSDLVRDMRTADRLKTAVRVRLKMQGELVACGRWSEAMALGAMPQNAPHTLRQLALLVDEMWHVAGDDAADITWYTKRAVLGGVYTSTEMYMLTDSSEGFADTWAFLDRRMDDVSALGRLPSELAQMASGAAGLLFRR